MNPKNWTLLAALLAAAAIRPALAGDEDLAKRIAACTHEQDDARRLACFDRAAASTAAVAPAAAAPDDTFGVHGSELARNLLWVGHAAGIKGLLTPEENLRWLCALHQPAERDAIWRALEAVGLRGFEDVPCHTLSAGQQRRVALARLYLDAPPLWILDEPFTALDKQGVAQLEAHLGREKLLLERALVVHLRLDRGRDLVEDEAQPAHEQTVDEDQSASAALSSLSRILTKLYGGHGPVYLNFRFS